MLKYLYLGIATLLATSVFSQSLHSREGIRDDRRQITRAFINAKITPEPGVTANTLIIRDGLVVAVGNNLSIPKDAVVIDLEGKYVYPSFVELYSDFGLSSTSRPGRGGSPEYERNDGKSAFGWNRAIRADQHAAEVFTHSEDQAKKLRKNGVGVVLSHQHDGIVRGTGACIALSNIGEQHALLQAQAGRFFSFDKGSSTQQYPSSQMGSIALLRQTLHDLEWYRKGGRNNEQHLHLEELLKAENLPAFFVAPDKFTGLRALRLGIPFILVGAGDEYQRVEEFSALNPRMVIPVAFPATPDLNNPYVARDVGIRELKHWELAPYNARILRDHKINFAFSLKDADKPFEAFFHIEKSGLSSDEILAALTTTPALFMGMEKSLGKLNKGYHANFIILDQPLTHPKAKMHEHWILGVQYEIIEKEENRLLGHYNLDSLQIKLTDGNAFQLILPTEDTLKGKFKTNNRRVEFMYMIDSVVYQAQISLNADYTTARASIYSDAVTHQVKVFHTTREAIEAKADTAAPFSVVHPDFDYATALWRPFQAFGRTSIPKQENILYQSATVWTLEGEEPICTPCDVLVEKGKIKAVGQNLKVPKGAVVVDASDKHITPGLIDEHSHIAISRGVNESGSSISAEVRIGDVVNPEDINIYRQLSGGTTASQLLHGSANVIGGQSALVKLRWGHSSEDMKIDNAPGFIKFALGENVKQSNWGERMTVRYPQSRMGVEQFLYEQFHRALEYANDRSKNKRIDTEMEALVEILRSERFISCHSYIQSEINMLMKVADSMGFTINTFTHVMEGYKLADKMKAHGAAGSTFSDWWAYKMEVNESIPHNAAAMAKAGVVTAINSDDAEMGRRLNHEAGKAIRYGGDDPVEALKMVTLNPAKMLHLDHRIGSIAVGKDADIVVWSHEPLSVYAKAMQTLVDGRIYFDREVHEQEIEAMRAERIRILQKVRSAASKGGKIAAPEFEIDNEYHCDTLEEIHFHVK
jgi:imidazolonepropionase-like amidohydrolase